jgi:hypothetical protein
VLIQLLGCSLQAYKAMVDVGIDFLDTAEV